MEPPEEVVNLLSVASKRELLLVLPGVIRELFRGEPFVFYHTLSVVRWAARINELKGDPYPAEDVEIAAWLHDIGRYVTDDGHAAVGREWAEKLLLPVLGVNGDHVLDAIENHGTGSAPKTLLGHIMRLADAVSIWDPMLLAWAITVYPCEEVKAFVKKQLPKKERVLDEYAERWKNVRGEIVTVKSLARRLLTSLCDLNI